MDSHTIELLDLASVLRETADFCLSPRGKRALESQEILVKPEEVKELLSGAVSFHEILMKSEGLPELSFPDIDSVLKPLTKIGTILEPKELADVAVFILSALRLKKYLLKLTSNPLITAHADGVPEIGDIAREILTFIHENGDIKDEKVPGLRDLKKRITHLHREVGRIVGNYANDPLYKPYLQSDVPTIKDGRAVLPVKTSHKGKIKGVVHEISGSGATVFLEPFEVVELNNEIVNLENEYRRELLKLLKELTSRTSGHSPELAAMLSHISFLDTLYAKARYAIRHNCVPARYDMKELSLKNARHPLITEKLVVPTSLSLGGELRILIITGPNTGGKTVTLKTAGLLVLMNQSGMEIPVDEGSTLPIFDNVFADIGDEQSLTQSLSTFSGHMVNIARIVKKSTSSSLVLLDELGAGTDPEEGVAIAMALLDHFINKGSIVLSTTHHGILKNYGYTQEHVENASMEFDVETLTPQFRLLMGIPGSSYAIVVAEKNGIPRDIIARAKSYLEDERTDISELIKKLSEKHTELLHVERKQKIQESELTERERKTDLKELKLKQKEYELRSLHLRETKEFLSESRKKLESLIRELREGEVSKEKLTSIRGFVNAISERVEDDETFVKKQYEDLVRDSHVEYNAGMSVVVKSTGMKGKILRKGKGGSWVVETETLKVSLLPHEMNPSDDEIEEKTPQITSVEQIAAEAVYQLDVRGQRLDEAIRQVEKQIDRAVLSGLTEFSIVHGMGDGILQRGIHEFLKTQKIVKDYYFSMPEHGGFGRTIVILESE